jgi:hypothetical protein
MTNKNTGRPVNLRFTEEGYEKIARAVNYTGKMKDFPKYLQKPENETALDLIKIYQKQAGTMAAAVGGMIPIRKYQQGGIIADSELNIDVPEIEGRATEAKTPAWLARALNPLTPTTEANETVKTKSFYSEELGGEILVPTIRMGEDGNLYRPDDPEGEALNKGDYILIPGPNNEETYNIATEISKNISDMIGEARQPKNYQEGGVVPITTPQATPVGVGDFTTQQNITDESIRRQLQPSIPFGAAVTPVAAQLTQEQLIPTTAGQVTGDIGAEAAISGTTLAAAAPVSPAAQLVAEQAAPQVATTVADLQAAQIQTPAQIAAAQQDSSAVSGLQAAQGAASVLVNPVQRQIQTGELVSEAANAQTASTFSEQIQAATAQPSTQATVQGQFEQLFTTFDAANPPPWASGAVRAATQRMVQRGLGASSIAGQAIVQATLEAALPIAQADAAIISQFERENLSNRQQRAMLAAQQRAAFIGQEFDQRFQSRVQNSARIGDIANLNFTAEQQIALENSRNVQTINLANLSNRQAVTIAEAAALANLDQANLNNRQQAAVQNAQNFLQADLANASAQQQTSIFKTQQRVQALFTDQAAENAALQFNATSQNQTDQFFAQLQTQTAQFNTAQANTQAQFNAGQINVVNRFNQEINNQRDQFNAKNRLVIDQSNAAWRRQIATASTTQVNRANELNAKAILDISNTAYNNLWQYYSDVIEFAVDAAESELNRNADLAIAELAAEVRLEVADQAAATGAGQSVGALIGTLGGALITRGVFGGTTPTTE